MSGRLRNRSLTDMSDQQVTETHVVHRFRSLALVIVCDDSTGIDADTDDEV